MVIRYVQPGYKLHQTWQAQSVITKTYRSLKFNLPHTKATKYNPIVEAATTNRIAVYTAKLGEKDNTVPEIPLTATAIKRAGCRPSLDKS